MPITYKQARVNNYRITEPTAPSVVTGELITEPEQRIGSDLLSSETLSKNTRVTDRATFLGFAAERDRLMDEQSVAAYLGCSVALVRKWRYSGLGPPTVRLGRLVKYRRSDVERFVDTQVRVPTAA